jgi:hypothetical protein
MLKGLAEKPIHSLVVVKVVNLIMQLTVHVQVHIEVADTVKEHLSKLYKHTDTSQMYL